MSKPKMHHFVPQGYLARFGENNMVTVKRREPAKIHDTNVRNIAGEVGLYTIERPDGTTSTEVEEDLADIDGAALAAMQWIDEHDKPPAAGSAERDGLCTYLAVQTTRTPRSRTMTMFPRHVLDYAQGRELTKELVSEYLEKRHLGRKTTPAEVQAAWTYVHGVAAMGGFPTKTDATQLSMAIVGNYLDHFNDRHWRLEKCRKPHFVTSDAPLLLWRRPSVSDAYKGIGILDAEEIRFPLDPSKQLVLTPGQGTSTLDVGLSRMWDSNRDQAANCAQIIVGHPVRNSWTTKLELRRTGPTLRFNMAPGIRENADGSTEPMGDVLHLTVR